MHLIHIFYYIDRTQCFQLSPHLNSRNIHFINSIFHSFCYIYKYENICGYFVLLWTFDHRKFVINADNDIDLWILSLSINKIKNLSFLIIEMIKPNEMSLYGYQQNWYFKVLLRIIWTVFQWSGALFALSYRLFALFNILYWVRWRVWLSMSLFLFSFKFTYNILNWSRLNDCLRNW